MSETARAACSDPGLADGRSRGPVRNASARRAPTHPTVGVGSFSPWLAVSVCRRAMCAPPAADRAPGDTRTRSEPPVTSREGVRARMSSSSDAAHSPGSTHATSERSSPTSNRFASSVITTPAPRATSPVSAPKILAPEARRPDPRTPHNPHALLTDDTLPRDQGCVLDPARNPPRALRHRTRGSC